MIRSTIADYFCLSLAFYLLNVIRYKSQFYFFPVNWNARSCIAIIVKKRTKLNLEKVWEHCVPSENSNAYVRVKSLGTLWLFSLTVYQIKENPKATIGELPWSWFAFRGNHTFWIKKERETEIRFAHLRFIRINVLLCCILLKMRIQFAVMYRSIVKAI